jgi:Domain of Unknown Function with PDB structure (DUF3857)/Transglutaminase-like superfamily
MKRAFNVILFLFPGSLLAQEYNVNTIPDSLITNANVVKRYEEMILEIKSPGKFISHERHVYTILNESGDQYADYRSFYDKFTTIDYVSAVLYNEKGKELKHVKKKDMQDFGYMDGYTLMQDERFIKNDFYWRSYPYTVGYEEDDTEDGVLNFSNWSPSQSIRMSVQYSKYVIIAPKDYEVRYKQLNFTIPPIITEKGNRKTYTWEVKNIPALIPEELISNKYDLLPFMMVAPSDFEAEGYKGNMSDWENYGKFIYLLKKGRDALPQDTRNQVHELTDNLKDSKQKIDVLYKFLQANTHYISVQLGIGGWQPFDATSVATKKYGDCKALSNYMIALLKEAGIMGKYVEIRAGKNARPIVTDFAESQFNHVICCVPLQKDTVWLECTSESLPAGYLSGFTSDRWGLLIDENGGKLVHTPKYGLKDNLQIRHIVATVNNEGNIMAKITTQYKAMQQDDLEGIINAYSNDKLLEYLKSVIDLPTYDIQNFHYTQHKDVIPSIDEFVELTATNYAQVSGKRLFINPDILTRSNQKLLANENRKYDLQLDEEHLDIDTVDIKIPAGYKIESTFHDTKIESIFGKYSVSVKVSAGEIMYIRMQEYYSGSFPAKDYAELVRYYEQVYKADHTKVVLVKQE